jgi:hypothetical protein
MVGETITDIKTELFSALEAAYQSSGEITATQQLGVSVSNAMKREGIVVIQNQNVEVLSRMVPHIVRALKSCDKLELPQTIEVPLLAAPEEKEVRETTDPIEECCRWMFQNNVDWNEMQRLLRKRYLNFVSSKCSSRVEAARRLKVGATYLSKLMKEVKEDK